MWNQLRLVKHSEQCGKQGNSQPFLIRDVTKGRTAVLKELDGIFNSVSKLFHFMKHGLLLRSLTHMAHLSYQTIFLFEDITNMIHFYVFFFKCSRPWVRICWINLFENNTLVPTKDDFSCNHRLSIEIIAIIRLELLLFCKTSQGVWKAGLAWDNMNSEWRPSVGTLASVRADSWAHASASHVWNSAVSTQTLT